ncbi:MAG: signal peptidase I [Oscillospiraceae bacterium]|nr:signal peptidase I [Oscillospiraceae bacterium]
MEKREQNRKLRNKIVSIAATVLLAVTVLLCLSCVVQVLSKGYVSLFGHSFFRVVTGSMEPTLSVGELIVTKDEPIDRVAVGDIVSFRSQSADMLGTIITHRVVEIDVNDSGETLLLTKGDANLSVDGRYVSDDNFIGRVIWTSDDSVVAAVLSFISGRYGFVACIVLPSVLLLSLILSQSISAIKSDMKKLVESLEKQKQVDSAAKKTEDNQEDYEKMCQQIRAELIEELKNCEDTKHSPEK